MSSERAPLSAEAVLAASADAVVCVDSELRVTLWNPAAERLFGWREEEVLGEELPIVPAELKAEHGAVLEHVRAGTPLSIHTRRVRKDGVAVDVRINTSRVPGADGGVAGWVLSLYPSDSDVQARSSAMERARLVRRLTDVVVDINADLSRRTVLDRISRGITELTGADAGGFVLLNEDRVELVSISELSEELRGFSSALDESLFGELLRSGKSVLLANEDTRGLQDLVWADLPGLHTIALGVSNVHGRPYGALYALYSQRKVGHVELELLELLAAHAGVAIGNALAYEELNRQRVHEQAVADSSADGIAVLDFGGRVLKWNRSAVELTGYGAEVVEGRHPPFPLPACHGQPVKHRLGDGRWLEILMAQIPRTSEWVVDFRDITAQKAMEDEREAFLATSGHELRTPITVIHGYATTLLRKWSRLSPDSQYQAVGTIAERSSALATLVDRLQLGSDVSRGEMRVGRDRFDLPEVLRQAVSAFRPLSDRHDVTLDALPPLPPTAGDPLATSMIMDQLLDNALKFSPEGGHIHVSAREEGDAVAVVVDDEGVGLRPGDEERVFDRFVQSGVRGDDADSGFGGLGLGLYIVRQLARDQGGDVTAQRLERGTRMRFTVPLHREGEPEPAERTTTRSELPHRQPESQKTPKTSSSPEPLPRQRSPRLRASRTR
ncbi:MULTISPECIES: PAS domain S-box protein [Nocardiopsis]|uniref:Sensor-like histidine kinase SenX3 n=1 Tax=Nocardiopsis sinuspersici TaxID=501010 RepID=A0A1V3C6F3_9ACTN|nr:MULTISPECIES: PAS domain S-box protein [Nocardiopsis]OOC56069.1 PAS domain-containing sensor histidine kinase [Nocardiopsis sinuspersici]